MHQLYVYQDMVMKMDLFFLMGLYFNLYNLKKYLIMDNLFHYRVYQRYSL